jgi:hypothetical protein
MPSRAAAQIKPHITFANSKCIGEGSAPLFNPCHPDRARATGGSKGEWKDPDVVSFATPHQGVLARHFQFAR